MGRKSMMSDLGATDEGLVNPKVSEIVAQANSLAAHATMPGDSVCARKWSSECPDGWTALPNSACLAPAGYENTGGCKGVQSFKVASPLDKYKFASDCNAPWPCETAAIKTACEQDYSRACPEGWTSLSGLCMAPATYAGHFEGDDCSFGIDTTGMTVAEKKSFAAKCSVQFPCLA